MDLAGKAKGNSIKWREYSQQSFSEAKQQLKPIFLLIAARWDRWCRLYEKETLSDAEILLAINEHFVPIFVDADRRRDLECEYFEAGLPVTVIFSARGERLLSFRGHQAKAVLMELLFDAASGKIQPEKVQAQEEDGRKPAALSNEKLSEFLNEFDSEIAVLFDELYGGFGASRKLPNAYALDYLAVKYSSERKNLWRGMLEKSLNGLEGLADREEDGFFRLAARRDWQEPEYCKLLWENSAIAAAYLKAGIVLENDKFLAIARKTYDWMLRSLYDRKEGGFFGSFDADEAYFTRALEERKKMQEPYIDRTKYADWNFEAAASFLQAHRLMARLEYWEAADATLSFMKKRMVGRSGVLHYYDPEEGARLDGLLLDNAWGAIAFLEAYRIGKAEEHLEAGKKILEFTISNFFSEEKNAFIGRNSTASDMYREGELRRESVDYYGNAVACFAMLLGYGITKEERCLETAKRVLPNFLYCDNDVDREALIAQAALNLGRIT